ncbi:M60 family metallopeptidase [Paenibacillus sp. KQZ6P-2]|uniref:M60 family metallopeptidase n=1 Tax=Paenibacillus mangrovi TaxID=2931978 RepID=A0A9X2B360_9BACL|nr:M60 family metallopeptidase [Paenibacillus mangrovi]MCJ8012600.1 M60 family metallopeptidase [Paenibacillus mangrovi]
MTIKSAKLTDLYKDYERFHCDVAALPAFVRSGGVTAIGESAFPVWIHPESNPIIAATRYGKGRVVAVGNELYFNLRESEQSACGLLARNILLWLTERGTGEDADADAGAGAAGSLYQDAVDGQDALKLATTSSTLTVGSSFPVELVKIDSWSSFMLDPSEYPVAYVDASISDAEVPVLEAYIRQGGSIVVAQRGWLLCSVPTEAVQNQTLDRAVRMGDYPLQKLLNRVGLCLLDSVAQWYVRPGDTLPEQTFEQVYAVHTQRLFDQAQAIERGELSFDDLNVGKSGANAEDKVRVITAVVEGTIRSLAEEAPLLKVIRDEAKKETPIQLPFDKKQQPYTAAVLSYMFQQATLDPDNVKSPYAGVFPRSVGEQAETVYDQVVAVDFDYLDLSYMRMLFAPMNWRSTGLYAPAGKVVTVDVPEGTEYLDVQIGVHTDNLCDNPKWDRAPIVTLKQRLKPGTNRINSPYGGLIYLIPAKPKAGTKVNVTIHGAVRAPYFVLGQTTEQEWNDTIRHYPVPWAELQGNRIIVTVPADNIRELERPEQLMRKWDEIADHYDRLVGVAPDQPIPHRSPDNPQRFVADIQISAGWMHSGYPIMFFEGVTAQEAVDVDVIQKNAWGFWHELGHNYQQIPWFWDPIVEVTVNLHSIHIQSLYGNRSRLFETGKDGKTNYDRAIEFTNSTYPNKNFEDVGFFERLVMIKQLQMAFGWEFYTNLHIAYRELPLDQVSMDEEDDEPQKVDLFMIMASKVSGCNLLEFFDRWGLHYSEQARAAVEALRLPQPETEIWNARESG